MLTPIPTPESAGLDAPDWVAEVLGRDLQEYEQKLYGPDLEALAEDFSSTAQARTPALNLVDQMHRTVGELLAKAEHLQRCRRELLETTPEKEDLLNFLAQLSAAQLSTAPRDLREDRRALNRWLDIEALLDRFEHSFGELQQRLQILLRCLPNAVAAIPEAARQTDLWSQRRPRLEALLLSVVHHPVDRRIAATALRTIATALPPSDPALQLARELAMDRDEDIAVQRAALDVLAAAGFDHVLPVLVERFGEPGEGEDLFFRRHAVGVLRDFLVGPEPAGAAKDFVAVAAADPSPFVRQGVAEILPSVPETAQAFMTWLARRDACPQVRAQALLAIPDLAEHAVLRGKLLRILDDALADDNDVFVRRVALQAAVEATERRPEDSIWQRMLVSRMESLEIHAETIALRRWAAEARERVWLATTPEAQRLAKAFREALAGRPAGRPIRLPAELIREMKEIHNDDLVGRVLAVLAQEGYGLVLDGGRLTAGPAFGFRLWRLLHEWRHPEPDKRQGVSHMVGRVQYGALQAPSPKLAEMSPTRVPGEPLLIEEEGSWRSYLPLLDDVLSCLNQVGRPEPIRFYTAAGVTVLTPPRSAWQRFRAWITLQWRFAEVANTRNWSSGSSESPAVYVNVLRALGIGITFQPHGPVDSSVMRFFDESAQAEALVEMEVPAENARPLSASLAALTPFGFGEGFGDYLASPYANDIRQLLIFLGILGTFLLGLHLWQAAVQRRARQTLPLVIGGWGTRGKSGTERLKAAVFNGLGVGVFSKTTGCEALFLEAPAFGELREVPIYRPEGKATIWEQQRLTRTASRLGSGAFLWECMGLRPNYVEILQRHWMRDDLSTLTNAYPDHEDVQGPAGHDVARSMLSFLPEKSRLVTAEEQMLPMIHEGAERLGTSVRSSGWLAEGLLTPDVLERFPYTEHPANVALVLEAADELGIDRLEALRQMASRVVPDSGSLRTLPHLDLDGRRLELTNGMSANERHAALGNWRRMGFEGGRGQDGVLVSTLVNNRADRLPRSKVFARMLVRDFDADYHVLVGTGLDAFVGLIREAWEEFAAERSTSGSWDDFESRLVVLPNASAEDVVQTLRDLTPEGNRHRIMAMQNIKGIGLAVLGYWEALARGDVHNHQDDDQAKKTSAKAASQKQSALLELFLGLPRSILRRRRADRILRDLEERRISRSRAAIELRRCVH